MIDDDEDTNFLVGFMLKKSELVCEYRTETSAIHALELLQQNEITPDCIFVDLTMPEMNGFDFVEEFENKYAEKLPLTRIYILSSSALLSDKDKIEQYKSVKEFVVKPLTKEKLNRIVNEKMASN